MKSLAGVDTQTILSGTGDWITPEIAELLAAHPLDCVDTEFPHAVWSVASPDERIQPRDDHPVFFGCYDWHSAVHSHWSLIRQLRLIDAHPRESEIIDSLHARITPPNVEQEVAYLEEHSTFEKPYGWAWFLRLAAELHLWKTDQANTWRSVFEPLEDRVVELVETEFLTQDRPFRVGTHQNSAFALQCVLDYARITSNASLETAAVEQSKAFYRGDRNAPVAYEPFGWDFLSPSFTEVDLMRRVLASAAFTDWIDRFLPDITTAPYDTILEPAKVGTDPEEEIALHLVGLNLSKAWNLAGIASSLSSHPYTDVFEQAAHRHVEASMEQAFTEEYAGSHWLGTFVLYLITRNAGGIAP